MCSLTPLESWNHLWAKEGSTGQVLTEPLMIFLTCAGPRWLACTTYELQLIAYRWVINNLIPMIWQEYFPYICKKATLWISQLLKQKPWHSHLLMVFKYLSLLLMLRVLIIYNENGLFLMLRTSPYAYRHLQTKPSSLAEAQQFSVPYSCPFSVTFSTSG